jgi:hypothetical protein
VGGTDRERASQGGGRMGHGTLAEEVGQGRATCANRGATCHEGIMAGLIGEEIEAT